MFDDEAIGRIVAAVGARFAPATLDRRLLAEDLLDAIEDCELARIATGKDVPTDRQFRQLFQALAKASARLRNSIPRADVPGGTAFRLVLENEARAADPAAVAQLAGAGCPEGVRSQAAVDRALKTVDFLAELFGRAALRAEFTALRSDGCETAVRLLFGAWLPPVFERHWGRRAGVVCSLASGAAGGPYVRFAAAVAAEFGLAVSAETVAAALKAARRNRPDV